MSSGSFVSCCDFWKKFPLDFLPFSEETDISVISSAIKIFKNPDCRSDDIKFLQNRDIHIISEFFSRYGEELRFDITKINLLFKSFFFLYLI